MALTPPAYGYSSIDLGPELGITSFRSEGGLIVTSRRGDPYVTGKLTTRSLKPDQFADFQAFLVDACDRNELIDIINPRYRLPRSYTGITWPLSGDQVLQALTDLHTLSVAGLIVDMALKRGDRLCLIQGSGASEVVSYRWLSADVTVTSSTAQALSVTPRLPLGVFAADCTVRFKNAFARVRVVPGSIEGVITDGNLDAITFGVSEALA